MQFAADPLALLLLRRQKLVGQMPQLFLHFMRLHQQLAVVPLALPEGLLRAPALESLLFQLQVRGGQIRAAPPQRLDQEIQVGVGLQRGAMSLLNRGDGISKKLSRSLHHPRLGMGRVARGQCNQCLIVNPGQVQCPQAVVHGLAPQVTRRFQTRPRPLLQVFSQRRLISSRQPD